MLSSVLSAQVLSVELKKKINHHAVGGSAASMSELSLVLQERAAPALPKLCTQVKSVHMCWIKSEWLETTYCVCALSFGPAWMSLLFLAHHRKAVTHYDLLGVKSDASLEEIKNAFFNKSKKVGSSLVVPLENMSSHKRAAFHSIVSTF